MLAVAIFLSVAALVAVGVVGYQVLNRPVVGGNAAGLVSGDVRAAH
jgi:mannose/fructose/N-acetylgalactosamine-specific phosphotransferase system component IIC